MSKVKQVLVWRHDLKVRKGKIGAQLAHASLKVISDLIYWDAISSKEIEGVIRLPKPSPIYEWLHGTFTKVCVYVESEDELLGLYQKAKDAGIPCSLITDSGATEFHGIPTKTCIAIGPDYSEVIDPITGHLKLL